VSSLRYILVGVAAVFLASEASAGDLSLRAGAYTDADAFFLGIEYRTPVSGRWHAAPNFELALPGDGTYFSANADLHYVLSAQGRLRPWLGAGIGLYARDHDDHGSDTDVGLNLIGGLGLRAQLDPYVQLKVAVKSDTALVLGFGVRF
jgi:hypothetical protein